MNFDILMRWLTWFLSFSLSLRTVLKFSLRFSNSFFLFCRNLCADILFYTSLFIEKLRLQFPDLDTDVKSHQSINVWLKISIETGNRHLMVLNAKEIKVIESSDKYWWWWYNAIFVVFNKVESKFRKINLIIIVGTYLFSFFEILFDWGSIPLPIDSGVWFSEWLSLISDPSPP